ncbi:hypothetical protein VNI00_008825 [Paramarasmius palmivorus]|uniref:Uncharacterized protein n=1 Tax=Paramarasmius palmivorus TaxID=297713 RepID=A0AAW0CS90_9AGAR
MKLILSLLALTAASAYANPVKRDTPTPEQCDKWRANIGVSHDHFSLACKVLADACFAKIETGFSQPWLTHLCVATATCQGTTKTVGIASCIDERIAQANSSSVGLDPVSQEVWSGHIETTCNTAPGRCPASRQQYIDFIYRTLDELDTDSWPDAQSEVIDIWWQSMVDFSGASEDSITFGQFVDFIRNSDS